MKILVFDIGGTAIKYGICTNGHLEETKEYPTEAFRGGTHILNTICRLSEQYLPFDAIGISTAGQVNPDEGSIIYANSNIPDYTGTQFKRILQKRHWRYRDQIRNLHERTSRRNQRIPNRGLQGRYSHFEYYLPSF